MVVWNVTSGQPLRIPAHHGRACVPWSADGKLLATGGAGGIARLWHFPSGEPLGEPLDGHKNELMTQLRIVSHRFLVTCAYDANLRFWDIGDALKLAAEMRPK